MTILLVVVALTRPIYGPYIDRFGARGDESVIQAAITQLNSKLEDRAKRNNLILPKPWGLGPLHHGKPYTLESPEPRTMR
jgi:hypothetical protein